MHRQVNVLRYMSLSFDGNNRISAEGYRYDAAGNLLMDGLNCYTYDAENRGWRIHRGLCDVCDERWAGTGREFQAKRSRVRTEEFSR
jgi:hypothetical protein